MTSLFSYYTLKLVIAQVLMQNSCFKATSMTYVVTYRGRDETCCGEGIGRMFSPLPPPSSGSSTFGVFLAELPLLLKEQLEREINY